MSTAARRLRAAEPVPSRAARRWRDISPRYPGHFSYQQDLRPAEIEAKYQAALVQIRAARLKAQAGL